MKDNPAPRRGMVLAAGKGTVWICEQQPQQYTGNILFDQDLVKAQSL